MAKNIVLVLVDQMRKDCIGSSGHPVVETPHLDMMRSKGFLFSSAYSSVPSCIAARVALMTGLKQSRHGRVGYEDGISWNYDHMLAGELAANGYHTQSIGKMHAHPARNLCGFHNVVLHDGYLSSRNYNRTAKDHWYQNDDYIHWLRQNSDSRADINSSGLDCNSWVARPWPYDESLHPTNWVVSESIDFLRRRDPGKPFFLVSSFVRPHSPLDPPQAYYEQYMQQDIPLPPVGDWAEKEDVDHKARDVNCTEGVLGERALKRARAAYYGLITHLDHQIGRLIQGIREYGELENTVILFTSDHGDMLGDHNLFRKALPYEGSAGIPFILYDPGNNMEGEHNSIIENPVELRDVMPTLLHIAGIDPPERIDGKSVLPLLGNPRAPWRDYIHGEHAWGPASNHFITDGKDKYIWFSQSGREQFFDLASDPEELHDLSQSVDPSIQERMTKFRNNLINELKDREEGYSDGFRLIAGRTPKNSLDCLFQQ